MFTQLSAVRMQTKLIVIMIPAMVVGALLASAAVWVISSLNNQVDLVITDARDLQEASSADVSGANLELAATNYLLTEDTDFHETQDRMREALEAYARRLDVYDSKTQAEDNDLGIADSVKGLNDALAAYAGEWDSVFNSESLDDTALQHGYNAIDSAEEVRSHVLDVYNLFLQKGLDRTNDVYTQVITFFIASVIGALLFIGLVIATVMIFDRQVGLPLAHLQEAADQFGADTFDPASIQPLTERSDEIGNLAQTFLKMVESVQADEQTIKASTEEYNKALDNLKKL